MSFVLIVSKDEDFSAVLAEHITRELAEECRRAGDLQAASALIPEALLVITDGAEVKALNTPILVLSRAKAPLRVGNVLAEIANLLAMPAEELILAGGYKFLPRARQMLDASGAAAEFTDREAGLLVALAGAGQEGLGKDALLKKLWGFDSDINTHTLETHIYRLRSKIRDAFGIEMIEATQKGYRLEV